MAENKFKQTCECKNCGNEAEMEITCTLDLHQAASAKIVPEAEGKTKGHAVCKHCGEGNGSHPIRLATGENDA